MNGGRCSGLELVFKDDETEELQIALRLLSVDSGTALAGLGHQTKRTN
jgi:hypothetical protein